MSASNIYGSISENLFFEIHIHPDTPESKDSGVK